jgi:hypothetical protein
MRWGIKKNERREKASKINKEKEDDINKSMNFTLLLLGGEG